jgi:putative lipoprotein
MRKTLMPIYIGFISLVLGCSETNKPIETEMMKVTTAQISGQVLYRERMLLPPGSVVKVSLEDVSKMDVASTVIASTSFIAKGTPPYSFTIDYLAADIAPRNEYNLRATINLNENLLFTSTQQLNPFKELPAPIEILVRKTGVKKQTQKQITDTGLEVVSVNPLAELSNTYWKLLVIDKTPIIMHERQPKQSFLQLASNDLTVKGFAGCNSFSGTYKVKGNSLYFDPLAVTRKACLYGMDDESKFLQALAATRFYSIHDHGLKLLNEDKKVIAALEAVYFN